MWSEKRVLRNVHAIYGMSFFRMFLIMMPVFVPMSQSYGLNMAQVMMTQALFSVVAVLMEIPSGYLSDRWGRVKTLRLGAVAAGLGFTTLYFAESFIGLLLFEAILGVGFALFSGSDVAILFEAQKQLNNHRKQAANSIGTHLFWLNLGEAIAALTASVLVVWGFGAIKLAQLVVGWLPLFFAFRLVETGEVNRATHRENARAIWRLLRLPSRTRLLMFAFIFLSMISWFSAWLYQPLWKAKEIGIEWFGFMWASICLVTAFTGRYAARCRQYLESKGRYAIGLSLMLCLPALAYALMAWATALPLLLLMGLSLGIYRAMSYTWLKQEFNEGFNNELRATINSVVGLLMRIMMVVGGLVLGVGIDALGAVSVAAILAMLSIFVVALFLPQLLKRDAQSDVLVPNTQWAASD